MSRDLKDSLFNSPHINCTFYSFYFKENLCSDGLLCGFERMFRKYSEHNSNIIVSFIFYKAEVPTVLVAKVRFVGYFCWFLIKFMLRFM